MLVSDIVRRNAQFFGKADAIVVPEGVSRTWNEVEARTNAFARALGTLGLTKGDRLAMFAPNCGEYIEFFFATAKSGVIGAATNVRLSPTELADYLRYVEPRGIVVHADVAETARTWLGDVPSLKHIIGIGEGHGFDLDLEQLLASEPDTDPGIDIVDADVYQLGATSGTTGVPKGAILTHRNAIAAMLNWMAEMPMPELGTNLQNIPLFFNPGGPAGVHPVFMRGGRSVIFPGFDPRRFLTAVGEYQVTNTILVPTMVGMVLAQPDCASFDVSSMRGIMSGGAPFRKEVLARAREVFGDVFFPLYGMAETYSNGLILRRENQFTTGTDQQVRRLGSVGKPNVLMQVRVVDDEGADVPRDNGTPGEIWMQGDTVSPGYFRMPEETAASRSGEWFKSGDVAVVDEDGFITIVDRKKDMIITGGINVFSLEVENALLQHPDVAAAAVIGLPDETWGEAIHAVLVAVPGTQPAVEAVLDQAAQRLAGFKKPRSGEFVDALPMSATGKLLKKELRAERAAGRPGST